MVTPPSAAAAPMAQALVDPAEIVYTVAGNQRPDDPVWNAANCRNRRIFDDRAGLSAARNVRPFLIQTYARDLGGGRTVMMKEIDAPIRVFGRHWGGFRTAYKI